jgi:hypothetical protein
MREIIYSIGDNINSASVNENKMYGHTDTRYVNVNTMREQENTIRVDINRMDGQPNKTPEYGGGYYKVRTEDADGLTGYASIRVANKLYKRE